MGRPSDRRRFLQTLGAVSALQFLPVPVGAQAPPPPAAESDVAGEARSLVEIVKRRHAHLDAAQLDSVRADLEDILEAGRTLRKLELRNADEPDIVFRAGEV